jgi:hypothetical protein
MTASGGGGGNLEGRRSAKDQLRFFAGPLLAYFDKRFQELNDRIDDLHDRIDDRMNQLFGRVATEVETMSEMTLVMQRFVDVSGDQVDELVSRMRELCDTVERQGQLQATGGDRDTGALESAFAVAAVGRFPRGAHVLHVTAPTGDPTLAAVLTALGYEVATVDDAAGSAPGRAGSDSSFDCVLWLPAAPDLHQIDLLRKSLQPGGELVMAWRGSAGEGFTDEDLPDWSVLERRVLVHAGPAGWQAVPAGGTGARAGLGGDTAVELVRATPRI